MFINLRLTYFVVLFLFSSSASPSESVLIVTESISLAIPLPDVVIITDANFSHFAFYFQGFGLPLFLIGIWSDSICKVHK